MKVSYNWLNEYLDLDVAPRDLAEKIARTSVDINDVYSLSDGLKKLVVGKVETCEPHPDSDHLHVCLVNVGEEEPLQIVCGAPNVAAGQKVIVALNGARIADNQKIKRGKIRGIESNGMLCALQEIGFSDRIAPKAYEEGIYILPEDAQPGESVFSYLGMDDTIIDTDVTPNRGDMLSIYGNVNDIAAFYNLKPHFKEVAVEESDDQATSDLISADVPDEKIAPTYKLRVIKGVKVADSPLWLQIRLWNSGIRPINNVVDVTNYVLLKYGQPLHSYDYDKLPSHDLSVRHAQKDEKFVTLDDEEQVLNENDIVVTSGNKPIALAGTMGGQETAVTKDTTTVALEAAVFDSVMVRKQARRLDLHSESSMRFERGINPETVETALNEAAQLITELAGGIVTQGIVTGSEKPAKSKEIELSLSKINHVLGTELKMEDVTDVFERLAFSNKLTSNDTLLVTVPARRWDISLPADLYEEVARIYGYDNLPESLPVMTRNHGGLSPRQKFIRATRHDFEGMGLNQAISYSLTTVEKAKQFQIDPVAEPMKLDFPMSSDHVATRMSIISGLLTDVAYNVSRNVNNVALYEEGRVFIPRGGERPEEQEHVAGVLTGQLLNNSWHIADQPVDFFQVKGMVERYLHNMGIAGKIEYVADHSRKEMHPGRTANILIADELVGFVGQVHPQTAKEYKIPETYVFELNLEQLMKAKKVENEYTPISKFPTITRDIALLVDTNVTNEEIVDLIKKRGGAFLKSVHLFDVYSGAHLPAGKKSLAYTLTYQDTKATLTEDQVNQAFAKVTKRLQDQLKAEIR
ncbi:phenylalanine--tRNA ligase subunit beta [Limosilactobacillus fastidiosus]|uniref:Phenylalanine--tRNA ligase beta subunit n=1 Tax=Limosilactobacillus fastidiosus TaxID=2759855 RepID=A0A7W3YD36_9LACO|nr:phenylalanine--tRNA ligase subunit beta [Limosilactobacillus fastidiosus]MBB1063710.1 phenylalanine--tRNA ligase subunit beta [Limosilactobacillus fastidiosus]MBB1086761.1 phenylalanine--tRNA ligase subunit beta [Limosilactobacillus fastidiosus]MCD7084285.1 phenylalanine--tRNA ligase subunit beta [Limosilactobacillus fastidiosus]MCD7085512.1 phenylalanine--tRNA ligase subunit beta [Limosilactobacillus fastidiosus]MCD7114743.1 phenylalanine--tRNA ligase subunit beta [Limosilactobacillus fast